MLDLQRMEQRPNIQSRHHFRTLQVRDQADHISDASVNGYLFQTWVSTFSCICSLNRTCSVPCHVFCLRRREKHLRGASFLHIHLGSLDFDGIDMQGLIPARDIQEKGEQRKEFGGPETRHRPSRSLVNHQFRRLIISHVELPGPVVPGMGSRL